MSISGKLGYHLTWPLRFFFTDRLFSYYDFQRCDYQKRNEQQTREDQESKMKTKRKEKHEGKIRWDRKEEKKKNSDMVSLYQPAECKACTLSRYSFIFSWICSRLDPAISA